MIHERVWVEPKPQSNIQVWEPDKRSSVAYPVTQQEYNEFLNTQRLQVGQFISYAGTAHDQLSPQDYAKVHLVADVETNFDTVQKWSGCPRPFLMVQYRPQSDMQRWIRWDTESGARVISEEELKKVFPDKTYAEIQSDCFEAAKAWRATGNRT